MYKKLAKDAVVVLFSYLWALALLNKLAATVIYAIFPHDIITSTISLGVGFALAYLGAWLFFNKWSARFWIKVAIASGIFILLFVIGGLIDAAAVSNIYPQ